MAEKKPGDTLQMEGHLKEKLSAQTQPCIGEERVPNVVSPVGI